MIVHYITIALRNFWKYKVQNFIGIVGMAIGIAFFTIGNNWMEYETSYDSFHPNSERIYQIYGINKQTGKKSKDLPMVLGEKLSQEFPEVENVSIFYAPLLTQVKLDDKELGKFDFKFVDEHCFEFFPPKIIAGKTENLLETQEELVITEDFARKYWSSPEEAIGAVFSAGFRYDEPLAIVAVMANPPVNSNIRAEGFRQDINTRKFQKKKDADKLWIIMDEQIFIMLRENVDKKAFEKKLHNYAIDNKYNENLILKMTNITEARHVLGSDVSFNITYIRTFVGAGFLLMFCALFNFLNLYVNRLLQRGREIKLRKTVGANNFSVIKLLQTELCLQLLFVFLIGSILLIQVIPLFEQRFEAHITQHVLFNEFLIISLITFIVIFIFCLLFEMKFIRFSALTQSSGNTTGYKLLRNISICVQLSICVFFIFSAFIFYKQVSLMNNFDWGFNSEGLIYVKIDAKEDDNISNEISQLPIVKKIAYTESFNFKKDPEFKLGLGNAEINGNEITDPFIWSVVSNNFLDVFEVPIVEGHMFTEEDLGEFTYYGERMKKADKVVITESFRKLLNMENVIGGIIRYPTPNVISHSGEYGKEEVTIIGVIKDFQITGLQNPAYPIMLIQGESPYINSVGYNDYVKVEKGREQEAIKGIREIFKKHASVGDPEVPEIKIISEVLDDMNKSENATLQLFLVLAVLCVIIAVFGIYSISSSNMERCRKEIAIRKVSGATAGKIVRMFLSEYSKMLFVANLIALPLAFYFMHKWLMQYPNKIQIEYWMFILVFVFTLIIVILTVFYQVVSAARQNPAEVIKSE